MQTVDDFKKGHSVTFGGKAYTIQEDKGWLHIVKREGGKRKKYDLKLVLELNDLETLEGWERLFINNFGAKHLSLD